MFTTNDLFEIAVNMEKNGEATYKKALEKLDNRGLQSLLTWMAQEEACHREFFNSLKKATPMEVNEADLKNMVPDAFREMMSDKSLSLEEVDFSAITSTKEMLATFIGFEKDTIMFYEMLEMFVDDQTALESLKKIVTEEKKHVEKLKEMLGSESDR